MSNTQGLRFQGVACLSFSAALAGVICLSGPAIGDEVKGVRSGESVSFQRDGMISDIYVKVGDQFRKGDRLLDFGASPQAVVTYKQAQMTVTLKKHALERKLQLFRQKQAISDDVKNAEKDLSDAESTIKMLEEIGSIKDSEFLIAPFDGEVTAILVNKGDRTSAGAPLMILSRPLFPCAVTRRRFPVGASPTR
jgi:biotin carboxyl carrier protein